PRARIAGRLDRRRGRRRDRRSTSYCNGGTRQGRRHGAPGTGNARGRGKGHVLRRRLRKVGKGIDLQGRAAVREKFPLPPWRNFVLTGRAASGTIFAVAMIFPSSSMAEQSAVNRWVVGSSPTSGANANAAMINAGRNSLPAFCF